VVPSTVDAFRQTSTTATTRHLETVPRAAAASDEAMGIEEISGVDPFGGGVDGVRTSNALL
jgi:hypothetical protein